MKHCECGVIIGDHDSYCQSHPTFRLGFIEGIKRAAEICRNSDVEMPIETWLGTKKEVSKGTAVRLASMIGDEVAE